MKVYDIVLASALAVIPIGDRLYDAAYDNRIEVVTDEGVYECSSDSKLVFNAGAKIQIKKARLVSSGATGLSTSAGEIDAKLLLIQGADAGGGAITKTANTSETLLKFANWNEWEDKNVSIEIAADGSKLGTGTGSVIHVDDFNIQDAFSGQQVQAVLEAEIEFSA